MEMIRAPLAMSLRENLRTLAESERVTKEHVRRDGDIEGNRHERRLAAKRARQAANCSGS